MAEKQENIAKSRADNLGISSKVAVEICAHLRHRKLANAKQILEDVQKMKAIIPFKKMHGCGHRKGTVPGRYPIKASGEILKVLKSVESNAQFKGLNTTNLVITKLISNEAAGQWHYGRHKRRKQKSTHVEIEVTEKEDKTPAKTKKSESKPAEKKAELKKEAPKPVETKPTEKKDDNQKSAEKVVEPKTEEKPKLVETKTEEKQK